MKIKQRPEDFVVTELDRYELSKTGPFCLYRLTKWDIGTLEALGNLSKHWNLSRAQISFGGLKDRHARCQQVVSIRGGPERGFDGSTFRVEYLGRARDPITRKSFDENAFEVVIRDLTEIPELDDVKRGGLPNYFDDQRFGSLRGTDGEFIGRALVRAAEHWARAQGCMEMASDADPQNEASHRAHTACGFEDVGLVRCFHKPL